MSTVTTHKLLHAAGEWYRLGDVSETLISACLRCSLSSKAVPEADEQIHRILGYYQVHTCTETSLLSQPRLSTDLPFF